MINLVLHMGRWCPLTRWPRWYPAKFDPATKPSDLAIRLLAIGAIKGA